MSETIWGDTLEWFSNRLAGSEPAPAGVATAAVTARFGLGLLIKVLEVSGNRKDFAGERRKLATLIESARRESAVQTQAAEEDVRAFRRYLETLRLPKETDEQRTERRLAIDGATKKAIEIPMSAARSAVSGLDLCVEATEMAHAVVAADLGCAAVLLCGAVRAILLGVDSNVRQLRSDDPHYCTRVMVERRDLETRALQQADATLRSLRF